MLKKWIGLLAIGSTISAHAEVKWESRYTGVRVEDCITVDSSDFDDEFEIDYYRGICPGQGPYLVEVAGGDLRYSVGLIFRGEAIERRLTRTIAFHEPGSDVVEWRGQRNANGEFVPKALIFRISAAEGFNEETGRQFDVSLLHVVRLEGQRSCTVAVLRAEARDNQKARQIAESLEGRRCL